MRQIRRLSDEEAQKYHKEQLARQVNPWINPISWIFADARLRLLLFMNIKPKYFHQRHRYPPNQRRLLDFLVISSFEGDFGDDYVHRRSIVNDLRYTYLKFLYRSEFFNKYDWIRVSGSCDSQPIYIWHEDVQEYHRQNNT